MKKEMSKKAAQRRISEFFGRSEFSADEVRKIKRLAMKFNIKPGNYRKLFCRKCLSKLKGKIRVTKKHKIIICERCGAVNKIRIS